MTSPQPQPKDIYLRSPWPAIITLGIVSLVIGLLVIIWPNASITVVVVLLGIQLVIFGTIRLVTALLDKHIEHARWLVGLTGVIGLVAGMLIMRSPLRSVEIIVTVLGIVWVVVGVIALVTAFVDRSAGPQASHVFEALLSVGAGALLLAWPGPTVRVVAAILGMFLILTGVVQVILGLAVRKDEQELNEALAAGGAVDLPVD